MIIIEKGKIVDITGIKESLSISKKVEIVEAQGKFILPGFIDLHVHGGGGTDVMDGEYEAIKQIAITHSRYGTSSFLPTTMTMGKDKIIKSLKSIQGAKIKGTGAAEIVGIHLERPYINPERKGLKMKKTLHSPLQRSFWHSTKPPVI